jgi:serine/threonine-protein kinase
VERTQILPRRGYLEPGTRLSGIYEIDAPLAAGGMGEVYRGHAIETGEAVAIKVIKADFAENDTALDLFRREALALRQLSHDAIVRYYVFAQEKALGRLYLAMEFVDGVSVAEAVKAGPMRPDKVLTLARRIGEGLHAAHSLQIIHRDVSPDNIVMPGGDVGAAKIIDFGIARARALGPGTIIGDSVAGKYGYMSPEQANGVEVGPQSDLYSFGLVLAEAARGRPLDMGGNLADVVRKRLTVPDLSDVDASLRPLLTAMLAPNPADRPASLRDIADWRPGQPIGRGTGAPASRGERGSDRRGAPSSPVSTRPAPTHDRRTRGRSLAFGAIALLGLGAAGVGLFAAGVFDGGRASAPTSGAAGPTAPRLDLSRQDPPRPERPNFEAPPLQEASQPEAPNAEAPNAEALAPEAPSPRIAVDAAGASIDPAPAGPQVASDLASPAPEPPAPPRPAPAESTQVAHAPEAPFRPPAADLVPLAAPENIAAMSAFLRDFRGGDCVATRAIALAPGSAQVEGLAQTAAPLERLNDAFKEKFGFEPEIGAWLIAPGQCAVAQFLAKARLDPALTPRLELGAANLKSGQYLTGTIEAPAGRVMEVLQVADTGETQNITAAVRAASGRAFNLRIERAGPAGGAKPQLILAIVSSQPLTTTRVARAVLAEKLLPALLAEAASRHLALGVGVRAFNLE